MPRMWYCWNVIVHGALSRTCLRWPLRRFIRELADQITLYNMKLSEDIAVHFCECPLLESLIQGVCRSCNLTSFSPCLTGPVDYPIASRHKGPGFKSPGGYLCETRILLFVSSHYRCIWSIIVFSLFSNLQTQSSKNASWLSEKMIQWSSTGRGTGELELTFCHLFSSRAHGLPVPG